MPLVFCRYSRGHFLSAHCYGIFGYVYSPPQACRIIRHPTYWH